MTHINRMLLVGRVTDAGLKLTYSSDGTPQACFALLVEEPGKEGVTFELSVPVAVFGTQAEPVAEQINAGDTVLIDGRLKWKCWLNKRGEGCLSITA